jgi:phosphatidate cytidylyltransferase
MKRILTALVLVALVAVLVLFGKLWMITLVSAGIAVLAALEYRAVAEAGGCPVPLWWTLTAIALFFAATFFRPLDTIAAVSLSTLVLFAVAAFRTSIERVLWQTAAGLLMLIYIAYPLTLIPQLWAKDDGTGTVLLFFLFVCVWTGDIAALYVGKRFGKHKLSALSPNKTWEGSMASLAASAAFGMAVIGLGEYLSLTGSSFTRLHTSQPWWQSLILAVVLNVAAQFGDLLESALKRGAGVKDSGSILPGHGGVLDRIDALLVAAPVLWFFLVLKEYFSLGSF